MTGEEYLYLKRGTTITVETPFTVYTKGQTFKVEFVDSLHLHVYIRDVTLPLGSQIKVMPLSFLLDNFIVGGELPEKKNNKAIELPFAVGDKAWLIVKNEVQEVKIIKCNVSIDINEGTQIYYDALYTSKLCFDARVSKVASNRLFKTKKELLESL